MRHLLLIVLLFIPVQTEAQSLEDSILNLRMLQEEIASKALSESKELVSTSLRTLKVEGKKYLAVAKQKGQEEVKNTFLKEYVLLSNKLMSLKDGKGALDFLGPIYQKEPLKMQFVLDNLLKTGKLSKSQIEKIAKELNLWQNK